jgi:hypothetical protein
LRAAAPDIGGGDRRHRQFRFLALRPPGYGTVAVAGRTWSGRSGVGMDEQSEGRRRPARPVALDDAALVAVTGGTALRATGGTGNDSLQPTNWDRPLHADGGAGHDTIEGTGLADQLTGGVGNDDIMGRDGNDVVWGDGWGPEGGADSLYGGHGQDTVFAAGGDDLAVGGEGNDMMFGGNGADTLIGATGQDSAYGGAGNDLFLWTPGEGSDVLVGDEGTDTLRLEKTGLTIEEVAGLLRYDGWTPESRVSIVHEADGKAYLVVGGLENLTLTISRPGTTVAETLSLTGFERIEVAGNALSVFDR